MSSLLRFINSLLFNIVLEGVFTSKGLEKDIRGTIFYRSLQFLGFAKDIDIIGRTTAKVREATRR